MYCKYCGQLIEEDSLFCRYCGKFLNNELQSTIDTNNIKKTSKKQTLIYGYILYSFFWVCYIAFEYSPTYHTNDVGIGVLFIVIPPSLYILRKLFLLDYYHYKSSNANNPDSSTESVHCNNEDVTKENITKKKSQIIESGEFLTIESPREEQQIYSLSEFVQKFGKMKICNDWIPSNANYLSYCVFTSSNREKTIVHFSDRLAPLNAEEIIKRKDELIVVRNTNNEFELYSHIDYKDNQREVENELPF